MKAKTGMRLGVRFGCAMSVLASVAITAYAHDGTVAASTPAVSAQVPAVASSSAQTKAAPTQAAPTQAAPASAPATAPQAAAPGAASSAHTADGHAAAGHGKSTTLRGEIRAKVLTIDAQAGSMVAKGDDGIDRHFVLDPLIRQGAAKVKPGDTVQVVFDRSVRVALKPDGEKAKPGIADNGFDATVTAVNKTAKMITIQGPKGNVFDLDVERADVFERIKANSVVHVEFGRPIARSVSPT